jgi:hypothetical protein
LTQMDESSVFATTVTFASPKITKIDSVWICPLAFDTVCIKEEFTSFVEKSTRKYIFEPSTRKHYWQEDEVSLLIHRQEEVNFIYENMKSHHQYDDKKKWILSMRI